MKKYVVFLFLMFSEAGHCTSLWARYETFLAWSCSRVIWNLARPFSRQSRLKMDISKAFARRGHRIDAIPIIGIMMSNIHPETYLKGLSHLASALETEASLPRYSNINTVFIHDRGKEVGVTGGGFGIGGLSVHISAHVPVDEIIPNMAVAILKHEIKRMAARYGSTSFSFKGANVGTESLASFLDTFYRSLRDEGGRMAGFPDGRFSIEVVPAGDIVPSEKFSVNVSVPADVPPEALLLRISNALFEGEVTKRLVSGYGYTGHRADSAVSAVVNEGVDDVSYGRALRGLIGWLDRLEGGGSGRPEVRRAEDSLRHLGRIHITENEMAVKKRDGLPLVDIYVPVYRSEGEPFVLDVPLLLNESPSTL